MHGRLTEKVTSSLCELSVFDFFPKLQEGRENFILQSSLSSIATKEQNISENFNYLETCVPMVTQNKELQIISSEFLALCNFLIQSHISQLDTSIHSFRKTFLLKSCYALGVFQGT